MSRVSQRANRVAKMGDDLSAWVAENPLRLWRRSQTRIVSQRAVGGLIQRSTQAIRDYESGSYRPDDQAMARLATVVGVSARTMTKRWDEWLSRRPAA